MFLKSKRIAVLGILLAICTILIVISGIIDINTLFFLGAASFCVGIAIREYGIRSGTVFLIASVLLALIIAPQKLYCITYLCMGLYILLSEGVYIVLERIKNERKRIMLFWIVRYAIFNIMYVPFLCISPKLVYSGTINFKILLILIFGGQIALLIFEEAYCYFQVRVWERYRKYLID